MIPWSQVNVFIGIAAMKHSQVPLKRLWDPRRHSQYFGLTLTLGCTLPLSLKLLETMKLIPVTPVISCDHQVIAFFDEANVKPSCLESFPTCTKRGYIALEILLVWEPSEMVEAFFIWLSDIPDCFLQLWHPDSFWHFVRLINRGSYFLNCYH